MIKDLSQQTDCHTNVNADIAIVGAGIAGLVLANRLAELGVDTVVVESGDHYPHSDNTSFSDVSFQRREYGGATAGRKKCLGGTSVIWGGALMPFQSSDFEPSSEQGRPGWPISAEDLKPYLGYAETLFGLSHSSYDAEIPSDFVSSSLADFAPREAKWPQFRNRNVYSLFRKQLSSPNGPVVWLNATAKKFEVNQGKVESIECTDFGDNVLKVSANAFILAAGAIESTRLLLVLDEQAENVIAGKAHLGRYLQDHLSVPLAKLDPRSARELNMVAGYRFDKSVMRSLRFEGTKKGMRGTFIHIAPRPLRVSGFDEAKTFMRSLQQRRPNIVALFSAVLDTKYFARLAYWRLIKKRLLWPEPAIYDVHIVIEQVSRKENRIVLSGETDSHGRHGIIIDWDISEEDVLAFDSVCATFDRYWTDEPVGKLGILNWHFSFGDLDRAHIAKADDIYHPTGTTRMASSADLGVVDRDMRVFGLENLHVLATSVFPNSGTANPTLTLILLALRLSEQIRLRT